MAPHELLNRHGTLTGLRPVLHEVFVVLVRSVRVRIQLKLWRELILFVSMSFFLILKKLINGLIVMTNLHKVTLAIY